MSRFKELFDLVTGVPSESETGARGLDLALRAVLATVLFGAIYGAAAGSMQPMLALHNLYKVPMVIVLSSVSALPIAMLVWKLSGTGGRLSSLLIGTAAGNFTGALVLAALAPVVALYYHSSGWLGGVLALATATGALMLGMFTTVRAVWHRRPTDRSAPKILLPVAALLVTQVVSLVQFIHIASPIIPDETVFDGGADAILDR